MVLSRFTISTSASDVACQVDLRFQFSSEFSGFSPRTSSKILSPVSLQLSSPLIGQVQSFLSHFSLFLFCHYWLQISRVKQNKEIDRIASKGKFHDCRICSKSFCCKQDRDKHEICAHENQAHFVKTLPEICLKCNSFVSSFGEVQSDCARTIMKTNILSERSPNVSPNRPSRKRSHSTMSSIRSGFSSTSCASLPAETVKIVPSERIKRQPQRKTDKLRQILQACPDVEVAPNKEAEEISPKFEGIKSSSTPVARNESDLRIMLLKSKVEHSTIGVNRLTPMTCEQSPMSPSLSKNARASLDVNSCLAVQPSASGVLGSASPTNISDVSVYGTPSSEIFLTPWVKAGSKTNKRNSTCSTFHSILLTPKSSITAHKNQNKNIVKEEILEILPRLPPNGRGACADADDVQLVGTEKNFLPVNDVTVALSAEELTSFEKVSKLNSSRVNKISLKVPVILANQFLKAEGMVEKVETESPDSISTEIPQQSDLFFKPIPCHDVVENSDNNHTNKSRDCAKTPRNLFETNPTFSMKENKENVGEIINVISQEQSENHPAFESIPCPSFKLLNNINLPLENANLCNLAVSNDNSHHLSPPDIECKLRAEDLRQLLDTCRSANGSCTKITATECIDHEINRRNSTSKTDQPCMKNQSLIKMEPSSILNQQNQSEDDSAPSPVITNLSCDLDFRTPLPPVHCHALNSFGILEHPESPHFNLKPSNDSLLDPDINWKSFSFSPMVANMESTVKEVRGPNSELKMTSDSVSPMKVSIILKKSRQETASELEPCFRKLDFNVEPSENEESWDKIHSSHHSSLTDRSNLISESPKNSLLCPGPHIDFECPKIPNDQQKMDYIDQQKVNVASDALGANDMEIPPQMPIDEVNKKKGSSENESISQSTVGNGDNNGAITDEASNIDGFSTMQAKTDTALKVVIIEKSTGATPAGKFKQEPSTMPHSETHHSDKISPVRGDVSLSSTSTPWFCVPRISKKRFHSTPIVSYLPELVSPSSADESSNNAGNHLEATSFGSTRPKKGLLGFAKEKLQSVFPSIYSLVPGPSNTVTDSDPIISPPLSEVVAQIPCQSTPDLTIMNLSAIQSLSPDQSTIKSSLLSDDGNYHRVSKRRPIWEWPKRRRPIKDFKNFKSEDDSDESSYSI